MVKDININTIYEGRKKIFVCPQNKLLQEAANFYNFDASNIQLFAVAKDGRKHRITPYEIVDFMKIEIFHKTSETMDAQRTLRSYFGGESSKKENFVEKIMTKLKNNSTLTGEERKYMLEWLQNVSKNSGTKRKHDDNSTKPKMSHKKVQVHMTATHSKDSFAQTDFINITPKESAARGEDTAIKIKRLAANGTTTNVEEIADLMNASYDDRRNFILIKMPPVLAVKDKYPLLFSSSEVKNELDRMFYPGKCDEFLSNIDKFSKFILKECDSEDDIVSRTEKNVDRSQTGARERYARCVGSILALPKLMEETLSFVNLKDNPLETGILDVFPYIDASLHSRKEMFFDNLLYKIYTEELLLCEASDFLEAILCLMASFFIFNIGYPKSCTRTLIMFEKLYLCANDTEDIDEYTQQMIKLLKLRASAQI